MRAALIVLGLGVAARAHADCDDAKAAAKRGELTRAAQQVAACPDDDPFHAQLARTLDDRGYAQVTIVTKPAELAVTLDGHPELALAGGDEVWLPAGTYQFASGGMASTVVVKPRAHAVVLLEVPGAAPPPRNGTIDFSDEGGGSVVNGPPPKLVHPSLIKDRYQKGLDASARAGGAAPCDPEVEDCGENGARARLGVALGAGATDGDLGYGAAAIARVSLFQLEVAGLRRGHRYDALAVPVLVRAAFAHAGAITFGGGAGAQGELRFDGGATRAGVSAIAQLDAEWPSGLFVDARAQVGPSWTFGLRAGLLF